MSNPTFTDDASLRLAELDEKWRGARRDLVERHLETLEIMGEIQRDDAGRYYLPVRAMQ